MNPTTDFDLSKILAGFNRRKGLILTIALGVLALSAYLAMSIPDVYRSSTLILITPQRVPNSFVSSTVTTRVTDRIHAITQEILSRTRLESIIKEFNLYPGGGPATTMEDRVEKLRKNIRLDVRRNDAFQISFDAGHPETAMKVTNRLGSLFIEQNLQVREQLAVGTTTFINAEAERLRKELEEQETLVNHYKVNNRFELPDQLDTNLRTLDQMRAELQSNTATLSTMQERMLSLQKQLVDAGEPLPVNDKSKPVDFKQTLPVWHKIQLRQKELDALLLRYSDKYPDVIRLKNEIKEFEKELAGEMTNVKPASLQAEAGQNPLRRVIEEQIESLKSSMNAIQMTNAELKKAIAVRQQRIENTPLRAIELSKVTRTYNITLRKYQDLLAKGLESQLSENLEKKQKGEQFQVIDPANLPLAPIRPNRPLILLGGLVAGIVAGFGIVFLLDTFDRSFRNSDDVNSFVDLPVLATLPAIVTRGAILDRRRIQGMLGASTVGIIAIGIILIRMFGAKFF